MNRSILPIVLSAVLTSCGGGSGGGSSALSPDATVSGVAATGSGIQGVVYLRDAAQHERSVTTNDGGFAFDTTGLVAPFILKAVWTGGELYSFSDGPGTANITPLTQAIVSSAAPGEDPAAAFASQDPGTLATLAAHLPEATAKCLAGLDPLLQQYTAAIDPISGSFSANHTGMDKLLDEVEVTFGSGRVTLNQRLGGTLLFSAPLSDLGMGLSNQSWSTAEALAAEDPSVAVDPGGQGLVVWSETDGARYHIQSKWLSGPNAPARLSNELGDAAFPKVAFDGSGHAVAVWVQYDGSRNAIWSSRFTAGAGWGLPEQISASPSTRDAYYPDLGLDAAGNAIAVWYEWDGVPGSNHFDVFSARFTRASGAWGAPVMRSNGLKSAYRCRVAVSPDGQGLLAWTQASSDGSIGNDTDAIVAQVYAPASGWSPDRTVSSIRGYGPGSLSIYGQVAVALDGSGQGTVLWVQGSNTGPYFIWSNQLASGSWGTAATISNDAIDSCYAPEVAYVGPGKAVAAWKQQNTQTAFTVAAASTNGLWGASTLISDGIDECYDPHLSGDAQGNATVIWFQIGASEVTIQANRYLAGLGWGTPQRVGDTDLTPLAVLGQLSTPVSATGSNASGQSFIAWGIDPM